VTAAVEGVPAAYLALRADAQRVLESWVAPDPEQELLRVELLAHCAQHPDAMSKQGPPAHLTASALVLNRSLDKVLLTLHAKAGLWLQFGGHFEPVDASVLAASTREAREESGIADLELHPQLAHLDRHTLLASGFGRCSEHLDLRYVGVTDDEDGYAVSDESLDVAWWPVDALPGASRHEIGPLVEAARRVLAS
jgi:8-oxo-dGTP pyrophosphatase MutT (NUDIX family)